MSESFSQWKFSLREGVWGRITAYPMKGRWVTWDAPWTEDVKAYGCPQRIGYYGKKWCWTFGAKAQKYDWKNNRWADWQDKSNWRRFVIYPSDHRARIGQ